MSETRNHPRKMGAGQYINKERGRLTQCIELKLADNYLLENTSVLFMVEIIARRTGRLILS